MLTPSFCQLTSKGFVGVIFNNYLCYGPATYVSSIEIPSKNEFENGEFIQWIGNIRQSHYFYFI